MFSLCELKRAAELLDKYLSGKRVQKIVQRDSFTLELTFYGTGDKRDRGNTCNLLISCRPDFARVSIIERIERASSPPRPFAQFTRARLSDARYVGTRIIGDDRQAAISLHSTNDCFQILLSILGSRSNIYLLDARDELLYAIRPFEVTRSELAVGKSWANPATQLKSPGIDRWARVRDEEFFEVVEQTYRRIEQDKRIEEHSRRAFRALTKESEFLERKTINLLMDRDTSEESDDYRSKGELLKGVIHRVQRGAEQVRAMDYKTGVEISIPLDPRLSPSKNLDLYFQRYQKASRKKTELGRQLEAIREARNEIKKLQSEQQTLLGAAHPDVEAIESFASRPRIRKLIKRYYPALEVDAELHKRPAGKKRIPARLLPKRYRSEDGLKIWVGRNNEGNDYLTTKLSRGNDLFFHLEGSPGSHVVLRTEGRTDPPSGSILDACELAVHFSRHTGLQRAEVRVAAIKNVKKPSGAKLGLVRVMHGKTVHLRRDPDRLQRVLASRLDE